MKRGRLAMPHLLLLQIGVLLSPIAAVPIKTPLSKANIQDMIIEPDECNLPGVLGSTGRFKYLEDCKTLSRFDIPIPYPSYGNIPRVCCPDELAENSICFPSDPWCPSYQETSYEYNYDYEDVYYVERFVEDLNFVCQNMNNTSCVPIHSCGEVSSPNVESFCGFNSDQIKVCCKTDKILEIPTKPESPRFTSVSETSYQCEDKTPHCKRWAANGACSQNKNFTTGMLDQDPVVNSLNMFNFMNLACQASCNMCRKKECVDEIPICKDLARQSFCEQATLFMAHTCRESCGTCGFLSPENTEEQVFDSKSYSNIESLDFDCGRYKALQELKDSGVSVVVDEFPDKPTDFKDIGKGLCTVLTNEIEKLAENIPEESPINEEIASADDFEIRSFDDGNDDINDTTLANSADAIINCGLILISDRWMLSAAHCFDLLQATWQIRSSSIRTYLPDSKEQVLQKRIFKHPNYKLPELYNDIAVVELGRRILFNYDNFGDTPTCLSSSFDFDEKSASVTGWGTTEEGIGSAGKNLGTVNITLTNYQSCQKTLAQYVKVKTEKKEKYCEALPNGILDQHICGIPSAPVCSGGEIVYPGACKGDSGGPVEVTENGKRVLVGLVSGSLNCNSQTPEWFTRVAYFRKWIECIIKNAKGNVLSKAEIEEKCEVYAQETSGSRAEYCDEV